MKTSTNTPMTKRKVNHSQWGAMIAEPLLKAAPEPNSKGKLNPITAARHVSALDSLLHRGIIDENRHAAEVAMLRARLG